MLKRLFLSAALIVGLFGVGANSVSAQTNQTAGQSRLERQIRREILSLPYYGVFDAIGYQLNGNTVTLTGYVVRPITKSDAQGAIEDIAGIERVVNNIEVLPLSPNDDRIRQRTLQTMVSRGGSLYRYFLGTNPSIRIIVNRGRIQLEGFVNNKGDYNLANILARSVPLAFGVTNNLRIINDER